MATADTFSAALESPSVPTPPSPKNRGTGGYDLARGYDSEAPMEPSLLPQEDGTSPQENPKSLGNDRILTGPETKTGSCEGITEPREWALRDSNPRHPPCKGGALAN